MQGQMRLVNTMLHAYRSSLRLATASAATPAAPAPAAAAPAAAALGATALMVSLSPSLSAPATGPSFGAGGASSLSDCAVTSLAALFVVRPLRPLRHTQKHTNSTVVQGWRLLTRTQGTYRWRLQPQRRARCRQWRLLKAQSRCWGGAGGAGGPHYSRWSPAPLLLRCRTTRPGNADSGPPC